MNERDRDPSATHTQGIPGITAPWPAGVRASPRVEPRRPEPRFTHEVARHYSREVPRPRGFLRRLKRALSRFFMAVLMRLPVPSEVKWQYSLDLIRTLTVEYYQDVLKTMPEQHATAMVARALYSSGRRWMLDMRREHKDNGKELASMGDLINRVFRALDIDSSVYVEGGEVVVINHRCPYLAHGMDRGLLGDKMCHMVCGMGTSLVEGLNDGLPSPLVYRSHKTMGRGSEVCVKHFSTPLHRVSPGRAVSDAALDEPLPPGPVPAFIRDLKQSAFKPAHPQVSVTDGLAAPPAPDAKPVAARPKLPAVHRATNQTKPGHTQKGHPPAPHAAKAKDEKSVHHKGKG